MEDIPFKNLQTPFIYIFLEICITTFQWCFFVDTLEDHLNRSKKVVFMWSPGNRGGKRNAMNHPNITI
jgi:hypothetical protein